MKLLLSFNARHTTDKSRDTGDLLYNHCILGEAMKKQSPLLWSVIHDVLGWVD